ncbi:MAG TPA: NADH-quinone oxidoreductase subunit A [Candidatus Dormibacteraeota bacterium]|nr:NADH-quinone oxidoreductase subunit A [Candidatus Dormibacteraeota bacterium]
MSTGFGTIALFLLVAVLVPGGTLGLALLLNRAMGTRRPHPTKDDPYESGMPTIGPSWVQFRVQYYLYALLFVLFDIEVLYLVPWAVAYRGLDKGYAFAEMALFALVLVGGLAYAWARGALRWE